MRTILVTGALGQIGSELVPYLRKLYGTDRVIATDVRKAAESPAAADGPFELLDVTDAQAIAGTAGKYGADTILHLAALLSATAETRPMQAWQLNMGGLLNALEAARELGCSLFVPSSIAAFGPGAPKAGTPQVAVQRPSTMYGISKAAGELLCDYYCRRFGVDARGLRFPGLISYAAPPGGGTTDYAVDMFVHAATAGDVPYSCYIAEGTYLDMMYMPDALQAIVQLMEADSAKLHHRNAYNVSAMSLEPGMLAAAIRRHRPGFRVEYRLDPVRQAIAESWPDSIDTSPARDEWGFAPLFDLETMTADMVQQLERRNGGQPMSDATPPAKVS
jgi:nucleoside-diphosphate-sugar epimerase